MKNTNHPTPNDHQPRPALPGVGWLLVIALVLYPLSTGPVAKLAEAQVLPKDQLEHIYYPLVILAEHSQPVRKFFEWYLYEVWHCDL